MLIANVNLRGQLDLRSGGTRFLHVEGRALGVTVFSDTPEQLVYIPSRDRSITVFGPPLPSNALSCLEHLDSSFSGATQTRKYAILQQELDAQHQYFLNIHGTHCGGAVITRDTPLYAYGMSNTVGESLVFADHDVAKTLRLHYPKDYWMFRLPIVTSGALFWSTEALCSRWYRWRKEFDGNLLKCFNALELMLFERRLEVLDA